MTATPILRDYQRAAIAGIDTALASHRSALVEIATGGGKSVIAGALAMREHQHGGRVLMLAHRDELLEQLASKCVAAGVRAEIEQAARRAGDAPVVVASVPTLSRAKRLGTWPRDAFTMLIADECFPAGTLVDGRPIETLRVGDRVRSYNHEKGRIEGRAITRIFASPPSTLVTVHLTDGRSITSTAGHPFFTGEFYMPAALLRRGDEVHGDGSWSESGLRRVRDGVLSTVVESGNDAGLLGSVQGGAPRSKGEVGDDAMRQLRHVDYGIGRTGPRAGAPRPGVLLGALQGGMGEAGPLAQDGGDKPSSCERADARPQPDAAGLGAGKDIQDVEVDPASSVDSRWQWNRSEPDGDPVAGSAASGMAGGICGADEAASRQWVPPVLQARSGAAGAATRDRGGRRESLRDRTEGAGREEAGVARVARVDRVEVHERRGGDGFGAVCPGDRVYNIEVDVNHNYFVDGILVHNCHHAPAASWSAILSHFSEAKLVGFTATADRADGIGLGDLFEVVAYRLEIRELIAQGHLVPITARRVVLDGVDLSAVRSRGGDLAQDELAAVMEAERAVAGVVAPLLEQAGSRRSIVFAASVRHAHDLAAGLNRARCGSAHVVHGELPRDERRILVRDFRAGAYQFLVNVDVMTEGVDVPEVSCIAMVRPTKSRARYVQAAGRGLRPAPAICKRDMLLLDFSPTAGKHRLIGPVDVLRGDLPDDLRAELDRLLGHAAKRLDEVIAEATGTVVQRRADEASAAKVRWHSEHVDPFLGEPQGDLGAIRPGWNEALATSAQLVALEKFGIARDKLPPRFSMEDASRLLARLGARRAAGLCSYAQAKRLASYGLDPRPITFVRASQLFGLLRSQGWSAVVLIGQPEAGEEFHRRLAAARARKLEERRKETAA